MQLINIQDKQLITGGISFSEHPRQAPLWVAGENVDFDDGKVRKQKGFQSPLTKPGTAPVRGMNQLVKNGIQTLYWGDQAKLYKWNSAVVTTEGTGYTMPLNETVNNPAGFWSLQPWGTFMTATNGTDGLLVDKQNGSGFVAMGGTPPSTAEIFIKKGIHLVALNTNLGGTYVAWCDDDDIDDWAGGNAGNLNIRDLDSQIKAAVYLADKIAVYSENTLALMSYPLAGFIFGAKVALEGIGAVSKAAVVSRGRLNYGLGNNGLWRTDGTTFEYFDSPKVKKWLQDNLNWNQKSKVNAVLHESKNTVEWAIPTGESLEPNVIIAYNFKTDSFTKRAIARTSQMPSGVFAQPYGAGADGSIYQHETTNNANGAVLPAYIQSKPFAAEGEEGEQVDTLVEYLRILLDEFYDHDNTIKVSIGVQQDLDDPIEWFPASASVNSKGKKVWLPSSVPHAAYVSIKIESTGLHDTWAVSGLKMFGTSGGELE